MEKNVKKSIVKHLKSDSKEFKKEIAKDKKLIKKLKGAECEIEKKKRK